MTAWIRIAHRGASGTAPENTLIAFNKALKIGVDAVEFDLHGTADGEVVVIHDATLNRTTGLGGLVSQRSLETIKTADAGGWFHPDFKGEWVARNDAAGREIFWFPPDAKGERVPTLEEALECITPNAMAVAEIKDPRISERVVAKIREAHALDNVVIISFHISALQAVRALEPRIPTGWLIGGHTSGASPIALCQQLGELGFNFLNVNHLLVTAAFAYEVRRRGIALWCWTVDDIVRMRELKAWGVQGITSNHPERFAKV
ncbi:hypothetical protein C6495_02260 [Candidatus Poribacteria bacterium]|nr:MAG: hypothetical protein C6495_02260 [Candidatus Poribacteria bacterium]